jgi:hypothetical protein
MLFVLKMVVICAPVKENLLKYYIHLYKMVNGFNPSRRGYPVSTSVSNSVSNKKGWMVGTNVTHGIGIQANLNRVINERTSPFNFDIDGKLNDDRQLVVCQNTLSGVGKKKSQFNTEADGIVRCHYYINDREYWSSLTALTESFSTGTAAGVLFSTNNAESLLNAQIKSSGVGTTNTDGFISAPYPKYVSFNGNTDLETHYKHIPEFHNVNGITWPTASPVGTHWPTHWRDTKYGANLPPGTGLAVALGSWPPDGAFAFHPELSYKPRALRSRSLREVAQERAPVGFTITELLITSITISYIAGDQSNGGDTPDMNTNLAYGKLTCPENLIFECVDQDFNVVHHEQISETKLPLTAAERSSHVDGSLWSFNWIGHGPSIWIAQGLGTTHGNFSFLAPYPNGSPFVPGQTTALVTNAGGTGITVAHAKVRIINSAHPNPLVTTPPTTTFHNPEIKSPLIWTAPAIGPYSKPLIIYPSGSAFTEVTIPLNISLAIPANSNNTIFFRIFQERATGTLDNYGIRSVSLNMSFKGFPRIQF